MQLSSNPSSTSPEVLLALMKARAARAAHDDFASYVKMMAPLIVPDFKWDDISTLFVVNCSVVSIREARESWFSYHHAPVSP